ncbi:MAG TPA: C4-type zinc ribbon domain-containing protein [Bacteroidia bacterium]|nr:C4-type zinc ribbon domain-containing protein [Bacteroidia bacterium]
MATFKEKLDASIEAKLRALFYLQQIDSKIDKIRFIRGELPLEVKDLEDTVEGLKNRIGKLQYDIENLEKQVEENKIKIKDYQSKIKKYEQDQNKVRNNKEFEAFAKQIEYAQLEIQLAEKTIKNAKAKIEEKKQYLEVVQNELNERMKDLDVKKKELKEIIAETEAEEKELLKQSEKASSQIDTRLINAYKKIRENVKNGIAVAVVERDACGGCFSKIPPQRILDIKAHNKIIVCEHCGRILVDATIDPNYVPPTAEEVIETTKTKRTPRKKSNK